MSSPLGRYTLKLIALNTPLGLDTLSPSRSIGVQTRRDLTTVPDRGRACSWPGLMAIILFCENTLRTSTAPNPSNASSKPCKLEALDVGGAI